jgi:hypothetical protein
MKARNLINVAVILSALLTACGNVPAAVVTSNQSKPDSVVNTLAWASIPFVDAKTGKNITFASYAGKTLVVEAMAVWCEECFYQ